jgi:DNA-binding NarL/FixJ family response regulator
VTIRLLLVDDQSLLRLGFRMAMETQPDIEVIGEAGDGAQAVAMTRALHPDVVLMDVRMPVMDGLEATRQIVAAGLTARILVLTTFHLDEYVYAALAAGAAGFLLKDTPPRQIVAAVRAVADGSEMLSPAVTRRLLAEYVRGREDSRRMAALDRLTPLSEREREVLVLVGRGLSNAEAARAVHMTEATVKTYVSRMLTKLGLTNRTQAAILAHEAGLLEED